ncbi:MAG: ferric iron uptake transcriptional regulator [Burkholderiaceae bacterium]|nr:ferric iron uptake transcriptional regulator [Burkholderiaceae bacterium]
MSTTEELKSIGLKATVPRMKILQIFQTSDIRHLSAEDVYKVLLHEKIDIGLATVYRVLTQFEQAGLLKRNHFESGKAVFELHEGSHHDHIVCMNCGHVEEFFDAQIEKRQEKIAKERGFHIQDHALSIYASSCIHCPPKKSRLSL